MTNTQRVHEAAQAAGLEEKTLLTYAEWKKAGFQVQKGQKAALKVSLWIPSNKKKIAEGLETEVKFVVKTASLFTEDQVKEKEEKSAA